MFTEKTTRETERNGEQETAETLCVSTKMAGESVVEIITPPDTTRFILSFAFPLILISFGKINMGIRFVSRR